MDFKINIRNNRNFWVLMLAMFVCKNAIAQSSSCITETVFNVNIQAKPKASFGFVANDLNVTFSNSSVHALTYAWDFGDPASGASNISSETNPSHLFSAPGSYMVTLTATNACGIQTITIQVEIACAPPNVSITPDGPLTFCEGSSTTLQAVAGSTGSYQWYLNDTPMPSQTNATLSVTAAGQYKVLITDALGCENYSDILTVSVHPLPIVSMSGLDLDYKVGDPAVMVSGSPAGGIFSGNGMVGNLFDPSIAGVGKHFIYYTYTDVNSCVGKDSVVVNISPTSGTSLTDIGDIRLFPNPNNGDFYLKIVLSSSKTLNFTLMNALGQTFASQVEVLPSSQSIIHFGNNELSSGLYFLKVMDGEKYAYIKILVTK